LDEDGPLALDAIKLLFSRARNHTATDFDAAAFIIAKMVFYTGSTDHKSEWRDYFQSLFRGSATRYSEALLSRGLPSRYEYKNTVTGELSGGYDLTGVSTL
jgi:hypothetical protein